MKRVAARQAFYQELHGFTSRELLLRSCGGDEISSTAIRDADDYFLAVNEAIPLVQAWGEGNDFLPPSASPQR